MNGTLQFVIPQPFCRGMFDLDLDIRAGLIQEPILSGEPHCSYSKQTATSKQTTWPYRI